MPQKPEGKFITKVHGKLSKDVYHQGMGLTSTNGTPDVWYEGHHDTLWIEYKWWDLIPKEFNLCTRKSSPKLSKLQQNWLARGYERASNVAVIVGSPHGAIFLPAMEWCGSVLRDNYHPLDVSSVADLIDSMVNDLPKVTKYKL
jgi:hypothetical protein